MIYKDFQGKKLSALGMGCMRFPVCEGDFNNIDRTATAEMVDYAIGQGINYFDTAWGYHGGNSETVLGDILSRYPRDSYYLATKFPGYDLSNMDKVEEIFEAQLKRLQTDYFDFYMFHNVCELNIDAYLDPKYKIMEYLLEQKKRGRIRHLGFSTHGSMDTVHRFLAAYGEHMEFCQIQLNWLDYKMQNAAAKVELLRERNIPIWVMEPLRGGKLATLDEQYAAPLRARRPDASVVEWAFRYLETIPEVVVTLSGMSCFEQLKENIEIFKSPAPLSADETALLYDVANDMTSKTSLPCTACRYCVPHCPLELDIPYLIELYNEHVYSGGGFLAPMAVGALPDGKKPSDCIGCRSCEAVCPQTIKISEMMSDFAERLKK